MLTPRKKSSLSEDSEQGRTRDAASPIIASPTHDRLSYSSLFPMRGSNPAFSGRHTSDLQSDNLAATLPGAWRCRISAKACSPGSQCTVTG